MARLLLALACFSLAACGATRQMVVAPEALAAKEAAKVLREGGNAVDAAVCAGFVLAVTHPEAGNLGGGGFFLLHLPDQDVVIDFRETAPSAATREMFLDGEGRPRPRTSLEGPLAAGVPGSVAGYLLALERFGKLDRKRVLEPAIRLAESGFIADVGLERSLRRHQAFLERFPGAAAVYLPGGRPIAAGQVVRLPELARTLRAIAERGADGFYAGPVAEAIERVSAAHGGVLTRADLAAYRPVIRRPLRGRYRDFEVLTVPPPSSGGVLLLQMLAMLEPVDLSQMRPEQRIHYFAEVARRAFADRAAYLGDPDFGRVPVEELLDRRYLEERRATIDMAAATPSAAVRGGLPPSEADATCHFSVVDRDGAAVSCTTTLNGAYGCGVLVAGFLLNNQMDDFTTAPGAPNAYGLVQAERNAVAPGKRPLSTMTPTILLRAGRPALVLGSPGGPAIASTVCQVIVNRYQLGMPLARAVEAPRFHHQWLPDEIVYETMDERVRKLLEGIGHATRKRDGPIGDVQAIEVDPSGHMRGVADPRGHGAAAW
jgi:gamma-glutamyltranspeptidase/glutathione hydrolase